MHHWHYSAPVGSFAGALGVTAPATVASVARSGDTIVYTVQAPPPSTTTTTAPPGQPPQPAPPPPPPPQPVAQSMPVGDFVAKANGGAAPAPPGLPLPFPTLRFSLSSSGGTATVDGGGWGHGVGMSQYGAYGKARRGMKAADILAAYYGGLRPVAIGPPQLPSRIRVGLDVGQASSTVTSPGRFRVLDGAGQPLALIALGRWEVSPAGAGKVRVVPPEGYDTPLAITPEAVEPALAAGVPATLRYRISTPAVVRLTLVAPGAKPVVVDAGVVDAGEATQALPPPPMGGAYQVLIEADAGPGRQASIPVTFSVAGPARMVIPAPSLLAAPRDEALWTRTVTAWRSFPSRLPLVLAGLLLLGNASFLGAVRARARAVGDSLD